MRSKPNTPHSARPKQTDGGLDLAQVLVKAGALQQAGQAAQAVALYRQWLAQPREAAEAALVWFNLGVLLRPLGDLSACMDA